MTYQPFIDDPTHIQKLNGQRFVVLRAPSSVSGVFDQLQAVFRDRLHDQAVSYPARPHVTLCGFAAGTSLDGVQKLVRGWVPKVSSLRLEVERVSWFPSPFQIVIVEVRKTPELFSALADLRARAEAQRLVVSAVTPVEQWRFHMSLAYCSQLDARAWPNVIAFAETVPVPAVQDQVDAAEVVAFDDGREYSGGVYALGSGPFANV